MVDENIMALREKLNAKRLQKARLNMEIRDIRNWIFRIKYGSKSRRRKKRNGALMVEAKHEGNPMIPINNDDENRSTVEVEGDKK